MSHTRHSLSIALVLYMMMILVIPLNAQSSSEIVGAAEGITLTVDFGNGTIREYNDLNGSTVLEVTSSVLEIEVQWFGPLAYIKGIEGLIGEGEYGWQYWVNGEFASTAVNLYSLEDGDTVAWVFSSPNPRIQNDPTFFPGLTIILAAGLGFIAIVYVQTIKRTQ
ncbi:MAG: DUF4430 domain-containing protein [Candidatus Sifarchaeia archaeon]